MCKILYGNVRDTVSECARYCIGPLVAVVELTSISKNSQELHTDVQSWKQKLLDALVVEKWEEGNIPPR
jgi:hypothetical protein